MQALKWMDRWMGLGWTWALAGVTALWVAGCGSPSGGGSAAAPPPAQGGSSGTPAVATTSIDLIRVGDKLYIRFDDVPTMYPVMELRVREDGTISLPLAVTVTAAGKKLGELEADIRAEYVPKFFQRLTVSAKVEERVIYVGGHVRRPDRYLFSGEMTLLGVIKVAGDFTEFAKRTAVQVTRMDGTQITVDCKKALKDPRKDVAIYPGDKIYVPQKVW